MKTDLALSHEIKEQISTAISEYLDKNYPSGTEVLIKDARTEIVKNISNIVESFVGPANVPSVIIDFYDDGTWDVLLTDWPDKGSAN